MKKSFFFLLIAVSFAASFSLTARAEEKTYIFGMRLAFATEMDAQNKTIFTDVIKAFSTTHGFKIDFKWFNSEEEFLASLRKREPDFFYSPTRDYLYTILSDPAYEPFVIPYMLNRKNNASCLYVNKDGKYKNLSDLRGADIIIPPYKYDYFVLRNMLNEKPDDFFRSFTSSTNPMSSVYSLAMNTTDSILAGDNGVEFMKVNNPGPTKKILPLKCGEQYLYPPAMAKKTVPDEIKTKLTKFLINALNEESLKKYKPLVKTYKIGFAETKADEFKPFVALYKKALKNGWDKDFQYWVKTVKNTTD